MGKPQNLKPVRLTSDSTNMTQAQYPQDESFKYPPLGEFDTQKALQHLEREQMKGALYCIALTCGATLSSLLNSALALGLILLTTQQIKKLDNLSNIIIVMKTLLKEFSDQGIEIIPRVPVPKKETGIHQIDLFVRIPVKKVYFVLCVRKMEQSKVVFHEQKGKLMRRRKKGLSPFNPDPLEFLPNSTIWVQRNQRTLFGRASNDKRRPCAKILVLVHSTKIAQHRSEFYITLGEEQFLCVKGKSPVMIVHHKKNLCSFIKNYIEKHGKSQSQATSKPKSQATSKPKSKPKKGRFKFNSAKSAGSG